MKRFFLLFGFNRVEQYGFLVFTFLILIVLFVPYVLKYFGNDMTPSYELVYFEESKGDHDYASLDYTKSSKHYSKSNGDYAAKKRNIEYFNFDPNHLNEDSWSKLGFSPKQIKVIMNYQAKGGKFYKKEDLAKIYVISDADYKRIEPYINIETKKVNSIANSSEKTNTYKTSYEKKNIIIDLNSADTIQLQSLYGIGPAFAKRIVKYRDALGGFYSIDQLTEVYGLPPETFEIIKPKLVLQMTSLTKININLLNANELSKHPYISRKQAQTIVNYRSQHGVFKNLESLSEIQSLDKEFLRKIGKYLEY